ncbi:MAG TPA: hypothetical protein VJY39_12800 [Acidisphaera sp.]|nr:hypothetical protein [Acidisphaera sp.]
MRRLMMIFALVAVAAGAVAAVPAYAYQTGGSGHAISSYQTGGSGHGAQMHGSGGGAGRTH